MKRLVFTLLTNLICICIAAETINGTCNVAEDGTIATWSYDTESHAITLSSGSTPDFEKQGKDGSTNAPWNTYRNEICKVVIGENVPYVGEMAFFNYPQLSEVEFAGNNTTKGLGPSCFGNCKGITSINIPASVETIGTSAFANTNVASINFAEDCKLKDIGVSAFQMSKITKLTIPESVELIREKAFNQCVNLESVIFSDNGKLISIGDHAFYLCEKIESVNIPSSVSFIGDYTFYLCRKLSEVNFAENGVVAAIGKNAFDQCESLYEISVPSTVSQIGAGALASSSIVIINNQTPATIGMDVFSSGSVIYVPAGSNLSVYKVATNWQKYAANILIGGKCGDDATWSYNENNNTLSISGTGSTYDYGTKDGHTDAPWSQYYDKLTKTDVTNYIVGIGTNAFNGCTKLIDFDFKKVEMIGDYAFEGCSSLADITIPASIKSIGTKAFANCDALTSVIVEGNIPATLDEGVFYASSGQINTNIKIDVPATSLVAYRTAWEEYADLMDKITNGVCGTNLTWDYNESSKVLTISGYGKMNDYGDRTNDLSPRAPWSTFEDEITSVVISENATKIGDYAFAYCKEISDIEFGSNSAITEFGIFAFSECKALNDIALPENTTKLGKGIFKGCAGFTIVTLPNKITRIGDSTFEGCTNLTELRITNTTPASIGNDVFSTDETGSEQSSIITIYVPDGYVQDYKTAWSQYASLIYDPTPIPTGIEQNKIVNEDAPRYNLQGQRVGKDYKGIVIIDGKKTFKF